MRLANLPWLWVVLSSICALAVPVEVQLLDAAGKPLDEVVVYAEPLSAKAPKGKLSHIIDQVDKEFVPLVNVVQVGTAISFPNKDNIRHNIYSFSAPKPFDLKLYSGTPSSPVVFDKPGQVVLGCNIHDWMVSYLLIVDTPWFDKTDARGMARLGELPAGEYELKVWHPYQTSAAPAQKIKLGSGAASAFAFRLKLAPPPASGNHNY